MAGRNGKITIQRDGPYVVSGGIPVVRMTIGVDARGESARWERGAVVATPERYALCRCGKSARKPFCDAAHKRVRWDGTETASRDPYLAQARVLEGPALRLTDAEPLCAFGRFCDARGGVRALVARSDDPEARRHAAEEAGLCPAGRLVAWDAASGQPLEPVLAPEIGVVEDPARGCSGGLAVWGGVEVVGADGRAYEARNRVTLCRCGASRNKPFCDGAHDAARFSDAR